MRRKRCSPFIMDNKSCFLCGKKGASSDMYLMIKTTVILVN
ncbi:hypothetical protein BACUNI_01933 [Bacteroides uniformis ATCC 8492]|uniref:Uncharacterized protein n=1 Tax=Bacteroides uniformis (strain ATCC 8492 / DSM 6597 / CCUG 4942 / CIP 103695 / JCM 5828 / KCTC 5204 / NCTC 13054 / VPI 0061) TaxID=411479 RepID=A0ABC9NCH3_BACUC|nr:hypothetical protein BACUNI_01933 [Bacteroides uniformis ATCC 8492]